MTQKRTIGKVTTGAVAGLGLAGALATLIVWGLTACGIDVPSEVASALATLLAGVGGLIGGYLPRSVTESITQAVAGRAVSAEEEATIQDPSIDPGEEYRAQHSQAADDVTGDWSQNGDPNTAPAEGSDYEVITPEQPEPGPSIDDVEDTDELESDYPDLAKLAQAQ